MLDALLAHLRTVAPDTADIPILQPADPFLDTAGEDLRRRIFITEAADGGLKCLRPEFTIPICLQHIENGAGQGRYAYGGTVFRQERAGAVEFQQAGLEDLGDENAVEADAACLADMTEGLKHAGIENPNIMLGDQQLFAAIVQALELPDAQAERLERNFGAPDVVGGLIDSFEQGHEAGGGNGDLNGLAIAGDQVALTYAVTELMDSAGISSTSGRSPYDIAARMIGKAAAARFQLDTSRADLLRTYLAIETPLEAAVEELTAFGQAVDITFGPALEAFEQRVALVQGKGVSTENFTFSASFGRKLDYYTGVLFEAYGETGDVLAGGGRYDRLCTILGADNPVPAVGFSIMMDRVGEALS